MVVSLRSWKVIEVTSFRLRREKLLCVTGWGLCAPASANYLAIAMESKEVVRNLIETWMGIILMFPLGRLAIGL